MSIKIQDLQAIKKSLKLQKTVTRGLSEAELAELVKKNEGIYHEYFDANYCVSLEKNVFDYINQHYFRAKFVGFENYPERNNPDRPLIFASNHSGMAFPWDAMVFGAGIFKMRNHDFKDSVRALVAPMLSETTMMNPFLLPDFWKRCGGIDATSLNFETLMQWNESNVLIYPEGVPGIGKGFNKRYQLQRFSTSFIRMAVKYQTDIIPVSTVNGEYINPYAYNIESINKIVQKIGLSFLPITWILLLLPFQPWLFYFAFPAKLVFVLGNRIKPYELLNKPYNEMTEEDINYIRDQVQERMQKDLTEAVAEYGKHPFDWKDFFKTNFDKPSRAAYFTSAGFPLLFSEHERRYIENDGKPFSMELTFSSFFTALWHNPFCIFFFIPILGWIPIILKGYSMRKKV
jgi:1-acyl-sn-glycerol-3-phosphate acyltransferase